MAIENIVPSIKFTTSKIDYLIVLRLLFYLSSAICLIYIWFLNSEDPSHNNYKNYLYPTLYFCMGIVAATIANSTGAGGGIVFLPIFIALGFSPLESLSTSIAIQCFGMTSGSLSWLSYRNREKHSFPFQWHQFNVILLYAGAPSVAAIWFTQEWLSVHPPIDIELLFSIFSLCVGIFILARTLRHSREKDGRIQQLSPIMLAGLVGISLVGGMITTWISVGVGELLLIYLICIGVRVNVAVASAVCISSVSVLAALPAFISLGSINTEVLVYAAPGALIGGVIARYVATYLGAHRLKLTASSWITLSAIPYLVLELT